MDNQITEEDVKRIIREELSFFLKHEKYTFNRPCEHGAGGTIIPYVNGTEIGQITVSPTKIGFFGATPVVQPDGVSDPTGGGSAGVDQPARDTIATVISRLETLGLIKTV